MAICCLEPYNQKLQISYDGGVTFDDFTCLTSMSLSPARTTKNCRTFDDKGVDQPKPGDLSMSLSVSGNFDDTVNSHSRALSALIDGSVFRIKFTWQDAPGVGALFVGEGFFASLNTSGADGDDAVTFDAEIPLSSFQLLVQP